MVVEKLKATQKYSIQWKEKKFAVGSAARFLDFLLSIQQDLYTEAQTRELPT